MKRGDIALFVLSKMAMIFFILALMSILIIFLPRAGQHVQPASKPN